MPKAEAKNRPLPSSKNPHFQNEAKCTTFLSRPVAGGGAGGARAPPEIFRLELNTATKVEFFY